MLTAKENMRRAINNTGPDRYVNQYEAMKLLFHPFMFHNPMAQKGEVTLRHVNESILELIKVTGFSEFLTIE